MTETLSVQALNRATLARQMLLSREPVPVAEAVGRLCGMQAQEPKPPFLGLWTRLEGFQAADLHSAFNDRSIVRATMMRATLHLMTAADYTAFRTTLQPMLDGALRVLGDRAKGLDLQKVVPAARSLLQEAPLTFNEVRASLQEMFPDVNDRALGYAARLCVPLVMIPTQDRWGFPRTAQFTLADSWLGSVAAGEPAVEELMLRYLAAYGPASAADAQTWSGLQSTGEALERLRPRLRVFADDKDRELFDLPDAPRPGEDVQAPARFLPEFDSLVLAHADRRRIIADAHRPMLTTKNLRVRAVFLWDGFARGIWETEYKRKVATLRMRPFEPLPQAAIDELTAEGEALLRFLEPDAKDTAVAVEA
ncbi:winged helix DNA-binding domain-containing protein [Actinomadura madurae]|uniref:winged helix DNA-binding domain-containing protein n=1 Tax=Actinomadura madurae TaxID=1993 RepID=UPI002026171C|nr:winged helix DNA-binding domain-containing protein [Actinomadura madurae]MCP9972583.1 winged helix DNA-binding domain-containing protein [Actinomadura madurae]MCQ0003343.1 winged helix DNA-binding domain-containing protein [Actinomadura madurae]URN01315.1 winged helix DNA-binding domain-containing protein [Actinomadura madurae]